MKRGRKVKKTPRHQKPLKVAALSFGGKIHRDFKATYANQFRISGKSVTFLDSAIKGMIFQAVDTIRKFNFPAELEGKKRLFDERAVGVLLRDMFEEIVPEFATRSSVESRLLKKKTRKGASVPTKGGGRTVKDVEAVPSGTGGVQTFGVSVPKLKRYIKNAGIRATTKGVMKLAVVMSESIEKFIAVALEAAKEQGEVTLMTRHFGRALAAVPELKRAFSGAVNSVATSVMKEHAFQTAAEEEEEDSDYEPSTKRRHRS